MKGFVYSVGSDFLKVAPELLERSYRDALATSRGKDLLEESEDFLRKRFEIEKEEKTSEKIDVYYGEEEKEDTGKFPIGGEDALHGLSAEKFKEGAEKLAKEHSEALRAFSKTNLGKAFLMHTVCKIGQYSDPEEIEHIYPGGEVEGRLWDIVQNELEKDIQEKEGDLWDVVQKELEEDEEDFPEDRKTKGFYEFIRKENLYDDIKNQIKEMEEEYELDKKGDDEIKDEATERLEEEVFGWYREKESAGEKVEENDEEEEEIKVERKKEPHDLIKGSDRGYRELHLPFGAPKEILEESRNFKNEEKYLFRKEIETDEGERKMIYGAIMIENLEEEDEEEVSNPFNPKSSEGTALDEVMNLVPKEEAREATA